MEKTKKGLFVGSVAEFDGNVEELEELIVKNWNTLQKGKNTMETRERDKEVKTIDITPSWKSLSSIVIKDISFYEANTPSDERFQTTQLAIALLEEMSEKLDYVVEVLAGENPKTSFTNEENLRRKVRRWTIANPEII